MASPTRSLRIKITASSTLAFVVVLVATAVVLVTLQRRQLVDNVDDALGRRADDLAATFVGGAPPELASTDLEDSMAQLVGPDGTVLAATPNMAGADPVAGAPSGDQHISTLGELPFEDDTFRLLSRRVDVDIGVADDGVDDAVLHIAENIDDIDDSVGALTTSLLVAFPALCALLAAVTWWLVGRTLRPVDASACRQRRFVADASHELRSPLTRIRTQLEVDLSHPETADLQATASNVLGETRAMERLIDDLLQLARDEDDRPVTGTRLDLDDIVLREVRDVQTDGRITVDVSGVSGAQVVGDPSALARLVRNLLDNAARHARSVVRLSLGERDGHAVLEVADDGPGIPAGRRDEVFERFTRLDEARSAVHGGTGLGLAIARDIVRRHGGQIAITDTPGGGSTFVIVLPTS